MPLVAAVELACGGDDPQEVPLATALAALKLEWVPTGQARRARRAEARAMRRRGARRSRRSGWRARTASR
eukprot:2731755-Pleurochrysis_carterae.AAC.1